MTTVNVLEVLDVEYAIGRFNANWQAVTETGCWIWTGGFGRKNYGRFRVGGKKVVSSHRFSYALHKGPIPDGLCVCHKCDTPQCVNPDHLFVATNEENTADRVRKGRTVSGRSGAKNPPKHARHHQAKLSQSDVDEIRRLASEGRMTQREIAALFGISQANVSTIKCGVSWYEGRRKSRLTLKKEATHD